jgi:hypothetical protein
MKLDAPKNANYAATVVRINTTVKLAGLDNLVGVPVLGYQALTQNDKEVGELAIAFTAETQLSEEYAGANNLYRESELNHDKAEKGYLEKNGRVRAIKLRGHVSNALLMPLDSVQYAVNPGDLQEGDTFDTLNGHEICRKYVVPVKPGSQPSRSKIEQAFKRVDKTVFPEHLDTDNYWRNKHLLDAGREVIITQKLHGTSFRIGHVPVLRELRLRDRIAKRLGVGVSTHEHDVVFGSRKVIKDVNNPRQQHFYGEDIWTAYGKTIAELIPEGYMVYGELVGFTPDGGELQKNYTYDVPAGKAELYVYRVAHINRFGNLSDLSWDGVVQFCNARGFKHTPELARILPSGVDNWLEAAKDAVFYDDWSDGAEFPDIPLRLSRPGKTVDEGVVVRQDGLVPVLLKAKSAVFLEHETKMLDKGEQDLESLEAIAA